MKTLSTKPADVKRDWYVVDAEGKTLGRLATEIAHRLRGKHKAEYTPHVDTGDYIVVVNAEKVHVSGAKATDKIYHHHTGYPGGLKSFTFNEMIDKTPEERIEELENSLSIALEINDKYQRENKELKEDNKKLAKQVEDKIDFVRRLRGKGLI